MSKIITCITLTKKYSLILGNCISSEQKYSYEYFFFLMPICFYWSLILKYESSQSRSVPIIFFVDLPILFDCFYIAFSICLLFYFLDLDPFSI
jgi:hypothetical protein